jgi:hypothetical protein
MLLGRPAAAGNPDIRLRTLQTEHFIIHYASGSEDVADRVAMLAERAHRTLTPVLGHAPSLRTHVLISDNTDDANGLANSLPFPFIRINTTAPSSGSVLSAYDDWLDILVTHEYVHVLHLDTVHGLPRLINAVLGFGKIGRVSAPNILQPGWVIEGLATWQESSAGSHGRRRSATFDMFLRMAVLENRFATLDRVTSQVKVFPHGSNIYLYGVHLIQYIASQYGDDKLRELSHVYGGRLIPFGINRALKDVIGVGYDELWGDFRAHMTRRFQTQARAIRSRGLRQGRRLTFFTAAQSSGQHVRYPAWSPDGQWLYFYADDGHKDAGFRRVPARGARVREGFGIGSQGMSLDVQRVADVEDGSVLSFVGADGKTVVFDRKARHDFRHTWSELFRWRGPDPDAREQLTFGLRAHEPDVSPDGKTVAFSRHDVAQTRLAFVDLATLDVTEVAPLERFAQVYDPDWSPDGTKVAYSGWLEGGYRDIFVYDRTTGETQRITHDRHLDLAPDWSPDGKWLTFSSDRGGVVNVHAWDVDGGDLWQVTNVLGGAYEPALSPDGRTLAYVGYSTSGFDLWSMPFDPSRFLPALPEVSPLRPALNPSPLVPEDAGRIPTAKSKRYAPWRTFFPRVLTLPAIEFRSSDFLTGLILRTDIEDFASRHRLGLTGEWLTGVGRFAGAATYGYRFAFPTISASLAHDYNRFDDGFVRYVYDQSDEDLLGDGGGYQVTGYEETATTARAGLSIPAIRSPDHSATLSVDYRFTHYENLDADLPIDPNAPAPELPEVGDLSGISLELRYSNLESTRYSYRSEQGRSLRAAVSVFDPALGGDFQDVRLEAEYGERIAMPWRGHQVFGFQLSTGFSSGGLRRRGSFDVGGLSTYQDTIRNLVNRTSRLEEGRIRGYPTSTVRGRHFGVLNVEYRIPVVDVDRGVGSLPVALERVLFVPFSDWGLAWTDPPELGDILGSVGASVVFDLGIGYGTPVRLKAQYARGLDLSRGIDFFQIMTMLSF